MSRETFLDITVRAILEEDRNIDDVDWIGNYDGDIVCTNWEEFKKLAKFEYSSGGELDVATDLVVVFKDGDYLWWDWFHDQWKFRRRSPVLDVMNYRGPKQIHHPRGTRRMLQEVLELHTR